MRFGRPVSSVLRNQLHIYIYIYIAFRELEAIREEEIQLLRAGSHSSEPPSGNKTADPVVKPKESGWFFGVGADSAVTSFFWSFFPLILVLALLLVAGKLWIGVSSQREESRVPDSPIAKRQLAQQQLARLRLRQHGIGR